MNFLKLIRNNWKKSAFAASLVTYGVYSLKNHIEITNHMRNVCSSVLEMEKKSYSGCANQPKSALVILNPVANKKSAEKMFKKYCEPILHLAGYSVEILKTNSVGHGKTLVENMTTLPDVIVCAGGDGTTSEVVTGLMRRGGSTCPIVLVPLGKTNKSAYKFANFKPDSKVDYLKCVSNAILPLIEGKSHMENVIKFDVIDDNTQQKSLKPIYGLNEFSWGILHDIENVKEKYWYFGKMKLYAAAILNSFSSHFNWNFAADFEASPPCPGCRNCYIQNPNKPQQSYLSKFLLTQTNNVPTKINVENKTCNTVTQGHIETSQLKIACNRNEDEFYELQTKAINSIVPGWNFIRNIDKITNDQIEPNFTLKSRTIQLFPVASSENNSFYSIDGEEYDVRPIKLSLIPKAIKIFC